MRVCSRNSLLLFFSTLLLVLAALRLRAVAQAPEIEETDRPPAPIVFMRLREVEPPRNVPAAQWTSPYCGTWDDGCTECTRQTLRGDPACKPVDHYIGGGTCRPRGIVCTLAIKQEGFTPFDRVCARIGFALIARPGTPSGDAATIQNTSFEYDPKLRRWVSGRWVSGPIGKERIALARSTLNAIGRDPDSEFSLTSKDYVWTSYCLQSHKRPGEAAGEKPSWNEMMEEDRR